MLKLRFLLDFIIFLIYNCVKDKNFITKEKNYFIMENENNYASHLDPAEDIFDKSKNVNSYKKRNLIIYLIPVAIFVIIWAIFLISSKVKSTSYNAEQFDFELVSKENRIDSVKGQIVRVGVVVENNSKHDATKVYAKLTFKNTLGKEIYSASGTFTINVCSQDSKEILIDLSSSITGGMDDLRALELNEIEMSVSDVNVYYSDFKTSDNASSTTKNGAIKLGIATVVVLLIWGFIIIFFRCPKCNSLFTLRIIDKEELDRQNATWKRKNAVDSTKIEKVYGDVVKYQITKKCKCCGKIIIHDSTEKQEWR